jgi:hypothetical protein
MSLYNLLRFRLMCNGCDNEDLSGLVFGEKWCVQFDPSLLRCNSCSRHAIEFLTSYMSLRSNDYEATSRLSS